jgi:ABC-type phosphate transport system substrate-binding protein
MRNLRSLAALAAVALTASLAMTTLGPPAANAAAVNSYAPIEGSGTSWTLPAIGQWINNVAPEGLTVDYNADGAAEGRTDYMQGSLVDFAASDPPFQSGQDKLAGTGKQVPEWGYSYIPDAAGGTAFVYHLSVKGHLIRNLRLSAKTLMGIFTGQIKNWDNPQITRDYGSPLPNLKITVVLHAEGAGDTYFFTSWLAAMFPAQWNAFCAKVHPGITPPCGPTEYYPHFPGAKMEEGSANVAAYIAASYGQGAIGYDEYSWALQSGYPVASLQNPDGQYVQPTAANVTTALTKAVINEDAHSVNFLQQQLGAVYTSKAPGSYPLASYSYLIVPRSGTKLLPIFTSAAGRTLSAFIEYALCPGQKELTDLGYAPLPAALVKGGLEQVAQIPGHVHVPSQCPGASVR